MIAALILSILVGIAAIFAGLLVVWAAFAAVMFVVGGMWDWLERNLHI